MCRVNDLVQLASVTVTGSRGAAGDADVTDGDKPADRSTELISTVPCSSEPISTVPCSSEPISTVPYSSAGESPASGRQRSSQASLHDGIVASVKPSPIVTATPTCTPLTCADALPSADKVASRQEAALITGSITEQQHAMAVYHLAALRSDSLRICASDTKSGRSVSVGNSVGSVNSAALKVAALQSPALLMRSDENGSLVKAMSSVADLCPMLAVDMASSSDVVSNTVSSVLHPTVSACSAGNLTVTPSSKHQISSISKETPDKLTLASGEQLRENNSVSTSLLAVGKRKVATKKLNTDTSSVSALTSSVLSTDAVKMVTATAPLVGTSTDTTCSVSSVTSSATLDKHKSDESSDNIRVASVSRKRPHDVSGKTSAEMSDSEEKRTKRAKLDEAAVPSTASQLPSAGSKDSVSSVKVAALTDTQRLSCYKTIGVREERARVIGLKTAERTHRKARVTEKVAAVGDVGVSLTDSTVDQSAGESTSSRLSMSSPRKSARRVPLVTVSAKLPATPTLFTLRSRARLAQLQQNSGSHGVSADSGESQTCVTETSVRMTSTGGDERKQNVNSGELHSADLNESSYNVSIVNQSASSKTLQPQRSGEDVYKKPQNQKDDHQLSEKPNSDDLALQTAPVAHGHQLRSSEKPNSGIVSHTAAAARGRQTWSSEKPNSQGIASSITAAASAAVSSADVNNKLDMTGTRSTAVSAAVVTGKTTSSAFRTTQVTTSLPAKVSDSGGKTTVTGAVNKRQSNIGTRSTRKSGRSDVCETVSSASVEDNRRNSLPCSEVCSGKAVYDRTSSARGTSEKTLLNNNSVSSRDKPESSKPPRAASENIIRLDERRQVQQTETVLSAVAESRANKVTRDVEKGSGRNSECRNERTGSSQGVACGNKANQRDAVASQHSSAAASSQSLKASDTSEVCNKSSESAADDRDLSQEIVVNINRHKVVKRTSTRTDLSPAISDTAAAEKHAATTVRPATPRQQLNVSSESESAVNASSRLSLTRKESVDLFDVAIAGTPAHHAYVDDSSESSLLSPFNIDVGDEEVNTAPEDVTSVNADFIVPNNPSADLVDASLCGKYAVSVLLAFSV